MNYETPWKSEVESKEDISGKLMPLLFEKARCIFANRKRSVNPDVGNPLYINSISNNINGR